ncbi:hypothetical protein DSECCO2_608290 [anaerobic digester metagenome]
MQPFGKVREKLLHVFTDQNTALHLADQRPHGFGGLLLQIIPPLGLFSVERNQLLSENFICQSGFDFTDALLGKVALPWIGAVANHVHMRVMRFIVKGRVPLQMVGVDFQILRQLHRLGGKQSFPCAGVIIAQPSSILPAQGNNRRPYISGVGGYFLRNL